MLGMMLYGQMYVCRSFLRGPVSTLINSHTSSLLIGEGMELMPCNALLAS